MNKDIKNRADIELLVDNFYGKVKTDKLIGNFFTEVIQIKWEKHLSIMCDFWENIIFFSGNYIGSPMHLHQHLHKIKDIEKIVNEKINSNSSLKERVDNILDIKGIRRITLATVVAETGGFEMFMNQKQLVSYGGYDVVENQSGKHVGRTRISKKGNLSLIHISEPTRPY